MKKSIYFLLAAILTGMLSQCSAEPEAAKEPEDRNQFGHFIPRGLTKTSEGLTPGYAMFSVPASGSTYLVDREGQVVHEWKGTYSAFNPYLMEDGSIVVGENDPDYPVFGFGGPYGRIEKISWDGKVLWSYELANENQILHHDFAVKPNGNILAIVYDAISYEKAMELGRAPYLTPLSGPWLERIVELEPEGERGAKVVWEWKLEDHLIQDRDESLANYGDPALHPERIDFNLGDSIPEALSQDSLDILRAAGQGGRNLTRFNRGSDLFHFNAINYNPALEQIAISSPELSEIIILDQSTTTDEAATREGGKSGRGGDILYRWGNRENYRKGDSTDRKLYYQHDVRWIEPGKPGAGHLTIFNNNIPNGPDSMAYTAVYEIAPPILPDGTYQMEEAGYFGPEEPSWQYIAPDTVSFYASFISGAHRMENGNTFINAGPAGRYFEVTPEGDIVWEYWNPYRGEIREPNGDPMDPMPMVYSTFRSTFVPADHPAFSGKELVPLDPQPEPYIMQPPPEKEAETDSVN
ncbi:aryl-sulfate sulfotransferase [Robiginitalea sp. SC105]|uniref:aryl-sulfate sulfotransferase n=1 Tax=Robiginitalea sp. SC105 TaxID=2762332 RepID=UPI00163A585D|nr:aryl-sulfate sulfotransferase [Robiginitalea sp. SC105]MBC2840446.1 aryl-sulfate sulfotransferase [Robiginitalea sp. SC105]